MFSFHTQRFAENLPFKYAGTRTLSRTKKLVIEIGKVELKLQIKTFNSNCPAAQRKGLNQGRWSVSDEEIGPKGQRRSTPPFSNSYPETIERVAG